jgi:hypothetical protein
MVHDQLKVLSLLSGCEARALWQLVRHGTRNPGDDDIELMRSRGPELRDAVVENHENFSKGAQKSS